MKEGRRVNEHVLISGGGIGGLAMGLTLHQIGVPFTIFESASKLAPLGVGINLQPNAVRELYDLGIGPDDLDTIGVPSREWALVGLNGNDIYSEPRGLLAGYKWPQYSVHRGALQMLLYRKLIERAGSNCVQPGHRVTGYDIHADGVTAHIQRHDGTTISERGTLLIAADGIHSEIRAQMHPNQPPIHWGGAIMWRGTTKAKPIRTGSSFVGLGTHKHRLVFYPISPVDPETGLATVNWIAERTLDSSEGWQKSGWFRQVEIADFIEHFSDWRYDWLDVPDMIARADIAYENPMIDRDPVPTWQDGPVVLMGDAAHAMYPTGSNGASQAVVDARILGAALLDHGVTRSAFAAFNDKLCGPISEVILRNRSAGPFGLLNMVDDRCGGVFDDIDAVIPADERSAFMARYKAAAGFAVEQLNTAAPTIPSERTVALSEPA
jgi:2-polyprenyl-6-methoxyphenol hydroxylase-like FAD-dependent oxidoreductase